MKKGDVYWVVAFVPVVLWFFGILSMDLKTYVKVVGGTMFVVEVVGFAWMWIKEVYVEAADTAASCNSDNVD